MSDADPTIEERTERYKENNQKYGLIRKQFWIPESRVKWYQDNVAKDRAAYRKKLGLDK